MKTSIYITIAALLFVLALATGAQEGFVSLFDGKTLKGWLLVGQGSEHTVAGPGYVIEDGMLVCPAEGWGNLFTVKEYANFILRFEFRLTPGANNGVGIRAPLEGRISSVGMEIQILDNKAPQYKDLQPAQYHGSVYDVIPAKCGYLKKAVEWNQEEILAQGRHIKVTLNGRVILDADLDSVKDPGVLKKHPGLARTSGHIGFLGHRSRVEFRNIRIRELP